MTTYNIGPGKTYETFTALVAAQNLTAGDIVDGGGNTFRETWTPDGSGSSGNVITLRNAVVSGADLVTSWTDNATGLYDWNWDAEEALPGDWSSETDTGSKLSISATAKRSGSNGILVTHGNTTDAYLAKTGLGGYTSTVYAEFYVYFSADFSAASSGLNIYRILDTGDWFCTVQVSGSDGSNVTLRLSRNRPAYADIGTYNVVRETWYKISIAVTGIGGASGAMSLSVDGTSRISASSIDLSAGYTIDQVMLGTFTMWGATHAGSLYFDDGWVDANGTPNGVANTWRASVTTEPKQVYFNGTRGTNVANVAACNAARKWYWADNLLYTYGTVAPSTTYASPGVEASVRDSALAINGYDYLTMDRLTLDKANKQNESYGTATNLTVQHCTITNSFYSGWAHYDGASFTITDCTVTGNGACGILVSGDGTVNTATITSNDVADNGWNADSNAYATYNAGIKIWGGANIGGAGQSATATIKWNKVSGQLDQYGDYSGTGIWVDQWGNGATTQFNEVHDCAAYGIIVENPLATADPPPKVFYNLVYSCNKGISANRDATGVLVYNNTVYGCTLGGLICEGVGIQTTMANNIFKNNISTGNGTNLVAILGGENAGGGSGNVYTYNSLGAEATGFIEWGNGVGKDTYDAFETAYGATSSSAETDPLLRNATGADFELKAGSPCLKAGTGVSLLTDYRGRGVPSTPDIGALQHLAPIRHAILTGVGQ